MKGSTIYTQSLVKSRDILQTLSNGPISHGSGGISGTYTIPSILLKYDMIERFLNELWTKLKSNVFHKKQTQYVIDFRKEFQIEKSKEFVEELINILKKEYPGVDFSYKETVGYSGNILESVIIMDWS